ncbi:helix-turn-helix transcriptional regulator [Oerskovia enterophila]
MLDTSVRLLRLLSLLQVRREWSGADLAARLDVTTRTVRNDVERLRLLGYEVRSRTGTAGGYRLAAGSELPPLLLDDDEAVAVAVGLQAAAAGSVTGIEETSVRALATLERSLPSRLRHRVDALRQATVSAAAGGPTVDAAVLTAVSTAIARSERVRFDYTGRDGLATLRDVEPHRLVYTGRRWYLLAWDTAREDWRTFRADRMAPRTPGGPRFTPREPPEPDVAQHVVRGVGSTAWHHRPRIRFLAPSTEVAARVTATAGVLTGSDDGTCVLETGSDSLIDVAGFLATVDLPFEVLDPPELRDLLRRLADLYSAGSREPADRPVEPGRS